MLTTPPAWKGLGSFSVGSRAGLVPMEDPSAITSGRFGGNSSASGLSSDGTQLFTTQATADNNGTVLIAYALPGMKQTWSQTSKDGVTFELRGSGGNVVVVERHAPDGTTTEGLNAHTGATLWSLPLVDVCGLSTTQMIVQVNSQTAVIDLPTRQAAVLLGRGRQQLRRRQLPGPAAGRHRGDRRQRRGGDHAGDRPLRHPVTPHADHPRTQQQGHR